MRETRCWRELLGVDVLRPVDRSHDASMSLTQRRYSARLEPFTRENLPPRSTWPEFLFTGPELQYPASINCATDLLDRHVMAGAGSRRCLVTDTETWTYADLLARSNQVAHVLVEEAGLVPGNRVLLRGPNNPWLVGSWFGVLKAGGVAVTTMPLLRAGELHTMAEIAETNIASCDNRFVEDVERAAFPDAHARGARTRGPLGGRDGPHCLSRSGSRAEGGAGQLFASVCVRRRDAAAGDVRCGQ